MTTIVVPPEAGPDMGVTGGFMRVGTYRGWVWFTDLPTVPDFPGFSRNSLLCPGVPELQLFVLHF